MLSWPLTVAITRAVGGWRSKGDFVQIDVRTSRVCTLKKIRKCTSWMSRLPLPDLKSGWVLRDHPFPSCVGRCLC
eukprot:1878639-Pleurochrysis_carterae.AAC.1